MENVHRRRALILIPFAALAAALVAFAIPDRASSRPSASKAVVRIAAAGDIAMIESGAAPGYFDGVRPYLKGGLVLGNLEGTLTSRGSSKCGVSSGGNCYAFRAPTSYATYLRAAGFTVMNTANNHAYDYGPTGLSDTTAALERVRLKHTGRPGEIAVQKVGSVKIAVVGFAPYSWAQSLTDLAAAQKLVRRAVERADLVIATMHAGAEGSDQTHVQPGTQYYLGENRGDVEAFAHAVVDAGADLVVGHGPHVLRGMEWYRGRLIAYSMGNFLGYKTFNISGVLGVSGVLRVSLRSDGRWVRGDLVPVRLVNGGIPERDPAEAAHGVVRELSKSDFGRRAMRISFTGQLSPPR